MTIVSAFIFNHKSMPFDKVNYKWSLDEEMERLMTEKKSASELQERKHDDWNDNYELYRNKVRTNRLTQRQAVNIPLMKETIKTILSKIDDPPEVEWKENSGDEEKELYYQEIWDQQSIDNKLQLVDFLDKKNVLLYGFSVKKLNIYESGVSVAVLDTFDILMDPLMNAGDIESSRFVIHQNIFKNVRDILANNKYLQSGKDELKMWLETAPGLAQSNANREELAKKLERLEGMGITSEDFSKFAGGDRLINITEHFTKKWNNKTKEFERRVVVYAEYTIVLLDELLEDLIGVDFWPFVVWNEDPETNDVLPDSVGDMIRTPNKVVNAWYSQLVENRTLKNFQMHWYTPIQGYTPQTYTPGPGRMLPAPPGDDINKVLRPVDISGLDDTLDAINIIVRMTERASGATAIDKGQSEGGQQTLGEVEILVGKSMERAITMAKFYRMAWHELAWKWDKMMHANAPKFFKLSKEGQSGKVYFKQVYQNDWVSKDGYEPMVKSTSEQEQNTAQEVQKWIFARQQSPNNIALRELSIKRIVDLLNVTPEELKQIEEGEKAARELEEQTQPQPGAQTVAEENDTNQLQQTIQNKLAQLQEV